MEKCNLSKTKSAKKTEFVVGRREMLRSVVALAVMPGTMSWPALAVEDSGSRPEITTGTADYRGYSMSNLVVDGCNAHLVQPKLPLAGRPWVWRTMLWDAFPTADLALLKAGFHLAFIDVGNTFGCPDAMKHFDAFHAALTAQFHLSRKPALEGLSRGGLYAYRWAYVNKDKVGCIYGDAPVCDMKSWPGGKGKGSGSPADWQKAIKDYHFASEQPMMDFKGNPIDILAPIAAAHIPILHVCGNADKTVPKDENTDIVRTRYLALGGNFALIVKEGCEHHPHGLTNPEPIVDFILSYCATGEAAQEAHKSAPKSGSVTTLAPGEW
jgi:pimeloyl-ACP methyl ester carboxylesterase